MYITSVCIITYLPYKAGRKFNYIHSSPGEEGKTALLFPMNRKLTILPSYFVALFKMISKDKSLLVHWTWIQNAQDYINCCPFSKKYQPSIFHSYWPSAPSRLHKGGISSLVRSAYVAKGLQQHSNKLKSLLRVGRDPSILYLPSSVFLSGKLQLTNWCSVLHGTAKSKSRI